MKLRPYQEDAIKAVLSEFEGGLRRVAVVLPTGAGKTCVFSTLTSRWRNEHKGKVVILVHRDELVGQTVDKLQAVDQDLSVGVVKGQRKELDSDVLVCSVQTVSRPAMLAQLATLGVSLVIADECHHASAVSWRNVLESLGCFASDGARLVGFTATLSRTDHRGLGDIFEKVAYRKDILDMVAAGYLANPRGKLIQLRGMALDNVKVSGGDYAPQSLAEMLESAGAVEAVAKAYMEHAAGRPGVAFWPTVDLAIRSAEAFQALGVTARAVYGSMPLDERRAVLAAYSAGRIDMLTNAMVLTEGWDAPRAEVCVLARPTRSASLYVQACGRVLRPYPGKKDALVLDVVGASQDHKLATLAELAQGRLQGVTLEDGESLTEAVERASKLVPELRGLIVAEDVDLFRRSSSLWLQTEAGVWFVPTQSGWTFLWPEEVEERYRIGWKAKTGGGSWKATDLELEEAMSAAEEVIEADAGYSTRTASWRKKREPASEKQKDMATRLGIEVSDGILKRELSDLITVTLASRALDPAYTRLLDAMGAAA